MNNENVFWPRNIKLVDIWINTAWAFISWVIWSLLLMFIIFLVSWIVDIPWEFKEAKIWIWWNNPLFPFVLSFITFIATVAVSIITYYFLSLTEPTKYKRTIIHLSQVSFFSIITYIFLSPLYIYRWMQNYDNIMYIFIVHALLLTFWVTIILEVMNNYRYILLWIYASFVWLFITSILIFFIFFMFSSRYAKLLSLLLILPLINWLIIFFKWLFEMIYYKYYMLTSRDPLWDIFRQIEQEEMDEYNEAVNENTTY